VAGARSRPGIGAAISEYAWVSAEQGQAFDDIGAAEVAVLGSWALDAESLPVEMRPLPWPAAEPGHRVCAALSAWAKRCLRPLVVLIHERPAAGPAARTRREVSRSPADRELTVNYV
jgi:hypothetical protein